MNQQPGGAPQQPWASPQQQAPWGPPPNYPPYGYRPPQQPQKSYTWLIILVIVIVVAPVLLAVAGGIFAFMAVRKHGPPLPTTLNTTDVPMLIETKVPCKTTCKVTSIAVYETGFTVTVLADGSSNRTLTYRVEPNASNATLMFSTDDSFFNTVFDPRADVDWSQLPRVRSEMQALAARGHGSGTVIVNACDAGGVKKPSGEVCFRLSVLTNQGNVSRVYDAKTGALRESH